MSKPITLTPVQAQTVFEQIATELRECGKAGCTEAQGGPRHFSGYLDVTNNRFINNGCESRGRQLQGNLTFAGHSHCSCDTCF